MAKMTKQQMMATVLERNGYHEQSCASRRYRKFVKAGRDDAYFVGKAGAVRFGRTITESQSISHMVNWTNIEAKLQEATHAS